MCGFSEGDYACIANHSLQWLHIIEARTCFKGIQMNGVFFEPGMQFSRLFCREFRWLEKGPYQEVYLFCAQTEKPEDP
jgi:hypothetical protein